jgi:hypothetical protein
MNPFGNAKPDRHVTEALARILTMVAEDREEDENILPRIRSLLDRENMDDLVGTIVLQLVPARVDANQWLAWLQGGAAPTSRIELRDPDARLKPGARGREDSARRRHDEAVAEVARLEALLQAAREELEARQAALAEAETHLRTTVVFALLREISKQVAGAFALGPAWTLMRVVSGYIQADPSFECNLDDNAAELLKRRRVDRPEDSTKMLDLLDRYVGDQALELRLHRAILQTLTTHHEAAQNEQQRRNVDHRPLSRAARQLRRTTEAQKASVRSDCKLSDRHEVLAGIPRLQEKVVNCEMNVDQPKTS